MFNRRLTLTAIVGLGLIGAGVAVAAPTSASTERKIINNCKTASYEPKAIVLTCADDYTRIGKATWTAWAKSSATGSGTLFFNPCNPCYKDKEKTVKATFKAFRAKDTTKGQLFTRLKVTTAKGKTTTYDLPTRAA